VQKSVFDSDALGAWFLGAILVAASLVFFRAGTSSDLIALYLAGKQFAAGQIDQIYAGGKQVFDLGVPDSWPAVAGALGLGDIRLYPYIYPPLWAAVTAPLTTLLSAQTFLAIASLLNPALMALSAALAWRIIRPRMSLTGWMASGLAIALITPIGFVALDQNQPQIAVSFLILLAIERRRARAPVSAGIALALASSIKLYPLLFIVIWAARRDWAPLRAFAVAGALLGLASLVVAGIDLNLEFLRLLGRISASLVIMPITFNIQSLLGQFLGADHLAPVPAAAPETVAQSGLIAAAPFLLTWVVRGIMIAGLGLFWRMARAADDTRLHRAIWPALLIFVSLVSPLSWAYHYLSVVYLFPALMGRAVARLRRLATVSLVLVISLPVMLLPAMGATPWQPIPLFPGQIGGTLAMAGIMVLFLLSGSPGTGTTATRPRPARARLTDDEGAK